MVRHPEAKAIFYSKYGDIKVESVTIYSTSGQIKHIYLDRTLSDDGKPSAGNVPSLYGDMDINAAACTAAEIASIKNAAAVRIFIYESGEQHVEESQVDLAAVIKTQRNNEIITVQLQDFYRAKLAETTYVVDARETTAQEVIADIGESCGLPQQLFTEGDSHIYSAFSWRPGYEKLSNLELIQKVLGSLSLNVVYANVTTLDNFCFFAEKAYPTAGFWYPTITADEVFTVDVSGDPYHVSRVIPEHGPVASGESDAGRCFVLRNSYDDMTSAEYAGAALNASHIVDDDVTYEPMTITMAGRLSGNLPLGYTVQYEDENGNSHNLAAVEIESTFDGGFRQVITGGDFYTQGEANAIYSQNAGSRDEQTELLDAKYQTKYNAAYHAGDTYRIAYQAIPALLWSSAKDILITIPLAKSGVGLSTTITGNFSVFGNGTAIIDNVDWGDPAYQFYRVDITVGAVTYRLRKTDGTAFGAPTNTACMARFAQGALLTFG